jgi:hypothetical protein
MPTSLCRQSPAPLLGDGTAEPVGIDGVRVQQTLHSDTPQLPQHRHRHVLRAGVRSYRAVLDTGRDVVA